MNPLDSLRNALAGRYTIERELGRGGTAIVYLAHDLKHNRKVALKVLNPELALSVRTERFLREIQLTAKLNHPHILALLDSGEATGQLFYVLPYVEGESLRDRLNREKPLPVEEALQIARDVAEALGYAHGQGIVHRDIKPENILLHAGHAVVMDFGIARALTVAAGQAVTESGIAVGTPAYMSPEQASGGDVDARSDIYSLGCVLYEMLAGHAPFFGATAQEILGRHALDTVPQLRAVRPNVPAALQQTIERALAKHPADRYRSAEALVEALAPNAETKDRRGRRFLPWTGVAAAALVVAAILGRTVRPPERISRDSGGPSVAVLSCLGFSNDPDNEYFSQGIAEELIAELSRVPGLRVPALTSSLAVKDANLPIRLLADTLGVAHLLECTVRRAGGRIRMSARLVRASDEAQLWSGTYDRAFGGQADAISLQEELAREVVTALASKLAMPGTTAPPRHLADSAAYDLYLQGQFLLRQRTKPGYLGAIERFEKALARDTTFALAYASLGYVYEASGNLYGPRAEVWPKARAAAVKAVALDDQLADGHSSLAKVYLNVDWDFKAAEQEFLKAIALNPNLSSAHADYADLLALFGRFDEAATEATMARRLDPLSTTLNIGRALSGAHHVDEAIADLQRVTTLAPDYAAARDRLGLDYVNAGRFAQAIDLFEKNRPPAGWPLGALCYAYARGGRRADAESILREFEKKSRAGAANHLQLALAYLGLGKIDRAVGELVTGVENRSFLPVQLSNTLFDELRSDPRIREMRVKIRLPP